MFLRGNFAIHITLEYLSQVKIGMIMITLVDVNQGLMKFYNIRAGYKNDSIIPCLKFDVQSKIYPIKQSTISLNYNYYYHYCPKILHTKIPNLF